MGVGLLEHIQSVRGSLKPTLQVVADRILSDPLGSKSMNMKALATECGVSEASISRFVRIIGLSSFRAFQLRLAEEVVGEEAERRGAADEGAIYESIGRDDTTPVVLNKVAIRTADVARACLSTVDEAAIEAAADAICKAGTLYAFAAGLSSLAAMNVALRFGRIGKPVMYNEDHNTQLLLAAALGPEMAAIGISDSGRTTHTIETLSAAKAAGAATIAITSFGDSPLARVADHVVVTPAGYTPGGREPLHEDMLSKFGQLVAVDVLYTVCAVRDYDRSLASVKRGDRYIRSSRSSRRHTDKD